MWFRLGRPIDALRRYLESQDHPCLSRLIGRRVEVVGYGLAKPFSRNRSRYAVDELLLEDEEGRTYIVFVLPLDGCMYVVRLWTASDDVRDVVREEVFAVYEEAWENTPEEEKRIVEEAGFQHLITVRDLMLFTRLSPP